MNERLRRRTASMDFNTRNARMRRAFRNTRASPTKSQHICEACESTACVSSTSRRSLVACSKWAHIHFSSGYAFVELISARWRSTDMCPCDAASKTVRLVEIFIDLSQAQIRHTREKTCEARFFIASELSGFARFASLRLKKHAVLCCRRPLVADA